MNCIICGEDAQSGSVGGKDICGWCDVGKCRYCGVRIFILRKEIDGRKSLKELREHMAWHKEQIQKVQDEINNLQADICRKDRIIKDLEHEIENQRKEIEYLEKRTEIC